MGLLSYLLTIIGIIVGVAGAVAQQTGLVVVGALLSSVGATGQYRLSKPFIKEFTESDWIKAGDEYVITIPARKHLRGRGVVPKVYMLNGGIYEAVELDETEEKDGSFQLSASQTFRGRAVLK